MAYGARALWSRSPDSSRGIDAPPGRTGEPFTGRSRTGGQIVSSHEVREMRKAILELTINRSRQVATLTTGELLDTERVTSSSERGGWKSVGNDNSLAVYSTVTFGSVVGAESAMAPPTMAWAALCHEINPLHADHLR